MPKGTPYRVQQPQNTGPFLQRTGEKGSPRIPQNRGGKGTPSQVQPQVRQSPAPSIQSGQRDKLANLLSNMGNQPPRAAGPGKGTPRGIR